jgi:hypothetical protein
LGGVCLANSRAAGVTSERSFLFLGFLPSPFLLNNFLCAQFS